MRTISQLTGMRGVYHVAAELSRLGFIVSPTSRSSIGADLLVTNQTCKRAYSVQVKTNARTFNFWLLNPKAREIVSPTHIYVFVNLRQGGNDIEYFVVPSRQVSNRMVVQRSPRATWYSFSIEDAEPFRNRWNVFGSP